MARKTRRDKGIGRRGGVQWNSLYDGMENCGLDEYSLAAALTVVLGKRVTPRRISAWLWGTRTPALATLRIVAQALKCSEYDLLSDMPKKNLP